MTIIAKMIIMGTMATTGTTAFIAAGTTTTVAAAGIPVVGTREAEIRVVEPVVA